MKYNIVSIIVAVILFSGCTKQKVKIDAISIGYDNQTNYGDIILTQDSSTFLSLLDTARAFQRYKRMVSVPQAILLRQEVLQDLSEFVSNNCDTSIDENKMRKEVYFTIGTFSEGKIKWCFYYLEDEGILGYFKKMLAYLNASKYKEDYKDLIPKIEFYIKTAEEMKMNGIK